MRVSTRQQSTDRQLADLLVAGGAAFTWLALRYQTLPPGLMMHALYNAIPEF
ncbi:CPBP family intramembrane glutamic endopeptidase [Arthrobacter celericrescens]|uniref:CPBP family intramembrane glutamic endopeptidase n=1 Tax=Arthrobacter celericrescens TaxID=2320851 RepID=UPI0013C401DD|nr:CPBP family intramembrane glutamic endopeptidase [Arthrobacter celericrescens]